MFTFDDVRRIKSAADLQLFAQGAEGDVMLVTTAYKSHNPHIDIYAGARATSATTIEDVGDDMLACIVLHTDGRWTRKTFPVKAAPRDDLPF